MDKSRVKDWFRIQIWPLYGGGTPEWATVSDIRAWLYETGEEPVLANRLDTVEEFLNDPGVQRKLASARESEDTLYEVLRNKFLKEPVINDSAMERARLEIPCNDSHIDLIALIQGVAGNDYTIEITEYGENTKLSCSCSEDGAIVVNLATDGDGVATTTAAALKSALLGTENFNTLFISSITGPIDALVEAMSETNLAGGADGHRLLATSGAIDDTVDAVLTETTGLINKVAALEAATHLPISGAPEIPVKAFISTGVDENWEIEWEAVTAGAAGNRLAITISRGTGTESPIAVTVDEPTPEGDINITVNLATDENGEPDNAANTATAVLGAVNTDGIAGLLIQGKLAGSGGACAEEVKTMLIGGKDGTPGAAGQMRFGDDKVFISVGESTATEYNWKSITFDGE